MGPLNGIPWKVLAKAWLLQSKLRAFTCLAANSRQSRRVLWSDGQAKALSQPAEKAFAKPRQQGTFFATAACGAAGAALSTRGMCHRCVVLFVFSLQPCSRSRRCLPAAQVSQPYQ